MHVRGDSESEDEKENGKLVSIKEVGDGTVVLLERMVEVVLGLWDVASAIDSPTRVVWSSCSF